MGVRILFLLLLVIFDFEPALANTCDSFELCRQAFLESVNKAANTGSHKLVSHELLVPSRDNATLTIQSSLLIAPQSERLVILSSGLHGIEGFVGTRMQIFLLKELWSKISDDKTSVLFLHGINPWGFSNKRRATENNVDLNRNFSDSSELYSKKNPEYMNLNDFLNPRKKASSGWLAGSEFLGYAIRYIAEFGITTLRKAILVGQYQEKYGIFFGGKAPEPNVAVVRELLNFNFLQLESKIKKPQRILAIDLHTGYGKKGTLHLLIDRDAEINRPKLEKIFTAESLDAGSDKNFYDVTGGYLTWLSKRLLRNPKVSEVSAVTFEFGTLDSQTIPGALDSLYRMQKENQLYHHGATSQADAYAIQQFFMEMYNPLAEDWNARAKTQFKSRINEVWAGL